MPGLAIRSSLVLVATDLYCTLLLCSVHLCSALCPLKCICNENKLAVWCNGAGLGIVPITLNPQLEELFLTNNHIKNILGAFSVYRNLKYLDMSNNQVSSVGEDNFSMQKNLEVLHLSRNMISTINNRSFSGLSMVRILTIKENFVKEIHAGVLSPLENLEELDLSKNRIERIADHAYSGLDNLKKLSLRDNLLKHIPIKSFHDISQLASLDLGLNALKVISAHSFLHLPELEELLLDGCEIHAIRRGAFKNLIQLKTLHLNNNDLGEIPSVALHTLSNLEHLRIGENKIQSIQVLSLRGLYSLKTLSVDGAAALSSVRRGAFADNSQLESVSLNYNKVLSYLDAGVFDGLSNLREVHLRGNKMVTVSYALLEWSRVELFDVRDNPLECNCSLLWLRDYLRVANQSSYPEEYVDFKKVVCSEPGFLKDVFLVDSTDDELGCNRMFYIQIWAISAVGAGLFMVSFVIVVTWYRAKMISTLKAKYHTDEKVHRSAISPEYPEEKVVPLVLSGTSKMRTGTML